MAAPSTRRKRRVDGATGADDSDSLFHDAGSGRGGGASSGGVRNVLDSTHRRNSRGSATSASDDSDSEDRPARASDTTAPTRIREDRRKTAHNVQERRRAHRLTSVIVAIQKTLIDHGVPTRKDKFSVLSTAYEQLQAWFSSKTSEHDKESGDNSGVPVAGADTAFPDSTFRRLFAESDLAMCILGAEGMIGLHNKRFGELFGLNAGAQSDDVADGGCGGGSEGPLPSIWDYLHRDAVVARDFILRLGMETRTISSSGPASSPSPPPSRPTVKVRTLFKTLHGDIPLDLVLSGAALPLPWLHATLLPVGGTPPASVAGLAPLAAPHVPSPSVLSPMAFSVPPAPQTGMHTPRAPPESRPRLPDFPVSRPVMAPRGPSPWSPFVMDGGNASATPRHRLNADMEAAAPSGVDWALAAAPPLQSPGLPISMPARPFPLPDAQMPHPSAYYPMPFTMSLRDDAYFNGSTPQASPSTSTGAPPPHPPMSMPMPPSYSQFDGMDCGDYPYKLQQYPVTYSH